MSVEQVDLEPATLLQLDDPFDRVLELMSGGTEHDFPVVDDNGVYAGMVVDEDVRTALLAREAIPLLLVKEITRPHLPIVRTSDDLATTMDAFTKHDVSRLAVCLPGTPGRVIGMISRSALMRRYQRELAATR
jgi:CIC family chloride channel protein